MEPHGALPRTCRCVGCCSYSVHFRLFADMVPKLCGEFPQPPLRLHERTSVTRPRRLGRGVWGPKRRQQSKGCPSVVFPWNACCPAAEVPLSRPPDYWTVRVSTRRASPSGIRITGGRTDLEEEKCTKVPRTVRRYRGMYEGTKECTNVPS